MKFFIQTILAILITTGAFAQQALVDKANQHYAAEEYQEAAESYEELLDSGLESAEVYYNLGNSYFKSGQATKAIINYERAKLLAPSDEDIKFNLELANQHVVDAIEPLPQVFFIRWWNSLSNSFSIDHWARISVICFILALILTGIFAFSRSVASKRLSFWFGILLVVVAVFSFNFASHQKKRLTQHEFAIVVQPSITVKSSPSETGTDIFVIHEGLKVQIKDSLGSWREIRLADGNQGWLPANSIERI
ncbi:tetratricopeptide repeat protein [Sunxiuqinia sp. A32]|uniref:tetratricopeptide repeat protein n=1 Tax=Sunxiuqinia sp. A32 TaxID=3461496 RepID=UPI004045C6F0